MAVRATPSSRPRALLSWRSGKDSAWALHVLRQQSQVEVVGLLTTLNAAFERVAMHAVRRALLDAQAQAVGLPLWPVPLPSPCSNAEYEAAMTQVLERARTEGVSAVAFGDLFLEDIRQYREERLAATRVTPLFPLWGQSTDSLARAMIRGHLHATVTCVDPRQLSPQFAGRSFDPSFLADLPRTVDPCGERGEFHTFAWDGPMFTAPIPVQVGETIERDGFIFTDLLPDAPPSRR